MSCRINSSDIDRRRHKQVVGQSQSVSLGHFKDFVLAVAVERSPLNQVPTLISAPVKDGLDVLVAYNQLAPFMDTRQAYDKRADLVL